MTVHLFVDTNVLLAFYHFTSEDLDQLRKLVDLIAKGDLRLHLPDQTVSELWRNRENKLADAIGKIRSQRLDLQFPQICKDYEEYGLLRQLQRDFEAAHARLIDRVSTDAAATTLKADAVLKDICARGTRIATDGGIVERARLRADLGNPPGKPGSVGDAVNWESLLASGPEKEDLHFVTADRDFGSPLDGIHFSPFLAGEWSGRKGGRIVPYQKLSDFLKAHFAQIRLASEIEKDRLIAELANSGTFSMTHGVIADLSKFAEFTNEQVAAIVRAALANNQVYWIMTDEDVNTFMRRVIAGKEGTLDAATLADLKERLDPPPPPPGPYAQA